MLDVEHDCLIRFVEAVLDHRTNGIREEAYLRLRQLADSMHLCPDHAERSHRIEGIIENIETTTDGRYFLVEDR